MITIEDYVLPSPEQMMFTIQGMRNSFNSWDKTDSKIIDDDGNRRVEIGERDLELMASLNKGGSSERKYLRMLPVYVRITAPLYWWKEFDTYKVGTVANSCSTMHKIHDKEFTISNFSHELFDDDNESEYDEIEFLTSIVNKLNYYRTKFIETHKKLYWRKMIRFLPSSYNQTRNVMLNYEVLYKIWKERKNHKLGEWKAFCKWIEDNVPWLWFVS